MSDGRDRDDELTEATGVIGRAGAGAVTGADDEIDRAAILARRQRFVRRALGLVGGAVLSSSAMACSCLSPLDSGGPPRDVQAEDAAPMPCLSDAPGPLRDVIDANESDADAAVVDDVVTGDDATDATGADDGGDI